MLATQPPLNPKAALERMIEMFFDTFQVCGCHIPQQGGLVGVWAYVWVGVCGWGEVRRHIYHTTQRRLRSLSRTSKSVSS